MSGVAVSSIFSTSANAFCIHFTASTALFASVIPDASRSDVREVDFIIPLPISRILAAKCSRLGSLSMERANVNFIEKLMTVRRLTSGEVMRLRRLSSLSVCKKPSNSVNNSPKQGYHVPRERTCDFLKHELCDRVVATSPCLKKVIINRSYNEDPQNDREVEEKIAISVALIEPYREHATAVV